MRAFKRTSAMILACTLAVSWAIPVLAQDPANELQPTPQASAEIPIQPDTVSPSSETMQEPTLDVQPAEVTITVDAVPLKAKLLRKKFNGYRITLTNAGPGNVTLLEAKVLNGINGADAYDQSKKKLIGVTSFLGISGFFTTAIRRKVSNNKANNEGKTYSNTLDVETLAPGQMASIQTLIPLIEMPQITVSFKDETTGAVKQVSNQPVLTESRNTP